MTGNQQQTITLSERTKKEMESISDIHELIIANETFKYKVLDTTVMALTNLARTRDGLSLGKEARPMNQKIDPTHQEPEGSGCMYNAVYLKHLFMNSYRFT